MKTNPFNSFKIIPFANPSGGVVHRVYGRMPDGRVIRENFKDPRLALARKQELEVEATNSKPIIMMLPTRLSVSELRDAEAASQLLKPAGLSMIDAANFVKKHYKPGLVEKTLRAALDDFLRAKKEANRGAWTILNLRNRVGRLARVHGNKKVHQITAEEVRQAIHKEERTDVSRKNERRALNTFFGWAVRKKLCLENPVAETEEINTCTNEPVALKLHEVRALLRSARDHAEGVLLPYVALGVFAGLRPFELRAIGWENIDLRKRTIVVPATASKGRRRRIVYLSDNSVEWFLTCQGKPLFPTNFQRHFAEVRKAAGFRGGRGEKSDDKLKDWVADVLRHTAISFFMGKHRNVTEAAEQFGNSPQVIFEHYRDIVYKDEAEAFYRITPTSIELETAALPSAEAA